MTTPVLYNKRLIKGIIGLLVALLLTATLFVDGQSRKESAIDILRSRWQTLLTGGPTVNPADPDVKASLASFVTGANNAWKSMNTSATRTSLWADYPNTSKTTYITSSYNRLYAMAFAYTVPGSSLYHNPKLLNDTVQALDWLDAHWYNDKVKLPTGSQSAENNWWDYEIGVPLALNNILVLLYDQLTPDQVSRYTAAIGHFVGDCSRLGQTTGFNSESTGANLIWKCESDMLRGILSKNSKVVAADRAKLTPVFAYVKSGDGFYTDGSFVQHGIFAYTEGYGLSLYSELTRLVYLLAGSPWDLSSVPGYSNLFHWVYDSFEPLVYKGAFTDMVNGRSISRSSGDLSGGEALIPITAVLSSFAPPSDAARLKSIVKQWMDDLHPGQAYHSANLFYLQQVNAILRDKSVKPRGGLTLSKVFAEMDRVMHQRPDFAFGISMFSNRMADYESINHENLHGWYTSYGMTYLYTQSDPHPFSSEYWPTVDPYRLPGTTVETGKRKDSEGAQKKSDGGTAGGVTLGIYSTAGMSLKDVFSPLQALKSWFMFDHEVVALGAGISDPDAKPVETIIDNRQINGGERLTVDGTAKPSPPGWSETMTGIHWAHLDSKNIGYYFPDGANVTGLRQIRSGAWKDINLGYSASPITHQYVTLFIDHGSAPSNATYAYVLLPNVTREQVQQYAAKPSVRILANTPSVQAVQQTDLHMIGANFWSAADVQVDGVPYLTSDSKASVMTRDNGGQLQVALSDPTQAESELNLEIHAAASGLVSADPNVTVVQQKPTIKLKVNVKNAQGKTFLATFKE